MQLRSITVTLKADAKIADIIAIALKPDAGAKVNASNNEVIMQAVFERESKARAWIESETRLISTILKTLNGEVL
ncbi:MAG: hypothetical protein ACP5T2_03905 [Thermoprotei archaeon]